MYRPYYQLQKPVNRKSIAVGDLFISESFRESGARLDYMKDKGGFVLITGTPGLGKTTLVRAFAESLDSKFFKIAYAPLSTVSIIEFYRQLSFLLTGEIPHKKDLLFRTIQNTILEMAVNHKTIPIIILDDAHFLKNENFFELQLIANFNFDSLSPALFILIAQPHLLERLRRPAFEAFYQRIALKIRLQPLTLNETQHFISQVITNASGPTLTAGNATQHSSKNSDPIPVTPPYSQTLFNQQAVELIFKRSKGIPRLITTIMEQALIYGAAHNISTIDQEVIYKIDTEL